MKKQFVSWMLLAVFATAAAETIVYSDGDLKNAYTAASYLRTSVHDPSIVYDTISNPNAAIYYVFGSHLGGARSTTLYNWGTANPTGGEGAGCTFFGDAEGNTVPYADAYGEARKWQYKGYNVQGNQWAPDMVYNPTMGKWLMYMSLNGDKWCSSIACFAADSPKGKFVYQGVVVYSGFQGTYEHTSYAAADDWTHTDVGQALGTSTLPARYKQGSGWGSYWPNCIDPCVFYDEQGKLWMSYGSWSGGIWMLELDETTGLRDYNVTYPIAYSSGSDARNQTSDPYFGKKISGGWYASGEGSYIEHIGNYYYLFISYGGFAPDGGYEMRTYRSENPDGPYMDSMGKSALQLAKYELNYGPNATNHQGAKLMGGYKWDLMQDAELSQGHNSAFTDKQGRSFVVYHTKFNDGTIRHEVRVHQLFQNQDGWLVASPYEYHGETMTQAQIASAENIPDEDIPGDYQVLLHNYKVNHTNMTVASPKTLTLTASADDPKRGTISNSTGTWQRIAGTDFIEIAYYNVVYKGVLSYQTIDYSKQKALCFSVVASGTGIVGSTAQRQIWGSKADTKMAMKYTLDHLTIPVSANANLTSNVTLPTTAYLGAKVTWTSSDESVLSSKGVVGVPGVVNLTLHIAKDGAEYQKVIPLTVKGGTAIETIGEEQAECASYDLHGRQLSNKVQGFCIEKGKLKNIK